MMVEVTVRKITREKLTNAIAVSVSIAEVLRKLEMSVSTGNYRSFHKFVKQFSINTTHLLGKSHSLGKNNYGKITIPLEEILIENSSCLGIAHLKKRLIREQLLQYKCYECDISSWRNNKLSLQLDHINGIHNDHRIENLRLLCPNCHSQTSTFCGKNKSKFDRSALLCACGKKKHKSSKKCKKCDAQNREKIVWPAHEKLLFMIENQGYSKTAKELNITRTAIVNRLERYNTLSGI